MILDKKKQYQRRLAKDRARRETVDTKYIYKHYGLRLEDFEFFKELQQLSFPDNMRHYAETVEPLIKRNGSFYELWVANKTPDKACDSWSGINVQYLAFPVSLVEYLAKELFPDHYDRPRKRANKKTSGHLRNCIGYFQETLERYMGVVRYMANNDFWVDFSVVSNHGSLHHLCSNDHLRTKSAIEKFKDRVPGTYNDLTAIGLINNLVRKSGVLDKFKPQIKIMLNKSMPALETLEELLAAILKLEETDIEARAQVLIDESIRQSEVKVEAVRDELMGEISTLHETIASLQDMIDGIYKQNELLLQAQEAQAGKYEGNLLNLLEKLKDEL